ncbi:MAG TPA: 2-C-methyl-D-erythritol 4-phosphate cytidylyltransferase [Gemmatimonadaceae bacterium]|jgi:2-C-methyl-D-erythritol 4-phosphate cytidylyltransferase|nr:2-C-methyl-D-erythritol 4-phosphate cytidylyltransferase [Gemmatimonadaceae bacterium]
MNKPDVGVIIVAAGTSSRTEGAELKQFRWVGGKPMLLHSVQTFQERKDVRMVVVVLPKMYAGDPPPWLFQCDTDRLLVSVGGKERSDSVRHGLEDLTTDAEIVAVHDAARPFAPETMIDRVIREARNGHGAVPGLPVVDTLKQVNPDRVVIDTLERNSVWRIQTPQAFPREMLEKAHQEALFANVQSTDDAALCERLGYEVVIVSGSEKAMKITTEEDFSRAEALSIWSG